MSDPAYIDDVDGNLLLTCGDCEEPLLPLRGGLVLIDINRAIALHICRQPAPTDD